MKFSTLASLSVISASVFGMVGNHDHLNQTHPNNKNLITLSGRNSINNQNYQKLTEPSFLLSKSELKHSLDQWFSSNELWKLIQRKTTITLDKTTTPQEKEKILYDKLFFLYSPIALSNLVYLRTEQFWSDPNNPDNFLNLDQKGLIPAPPHRNMSSHHRKNSLVSAPPSIHQVIPNNLEKNPRQYYPKKRTVSNEILQNPENNAEDLQSAIDQAKEILYEVFGTADQQIMNDISHRVLGTTSPCSKEISQNLITTKNYDKKSEAWKKLFDLPDYSSDEEKIRFFEVAERDFKIPSDKAQQIISEWRSTEREIYASEKELNEDKLIKWRTYKKTIVQQNDSVFQTVLAKARKARNDICEKYNEYDPENVKNLIFYHDFMLIQLDNECLSFYRKERCFDNGPLLVPNIQNWLRKNNLYTNLSKLIFDIVSDGNEEYSETISKHYGKSLDYILDTKSIIKSWFNLSERNRRYVTNKVNHLGSSVDLMDLTIEKNERLSINVIANLIKNPEREITLGDNYASIDIHKKYASVWKILIQRNFQKPKWCKGTQKRKKVVLKRSDDRKYLCYLNKLLGFSNHLKHMDYLEARNKSVFSFWRYKRESQNQEDDSMLKKEIANYFDITVSTLLLIDKKNVEPINIEDIVQKKIDKYNNLFENNKIVFYADKINVIKNELSSEFRKIVYYLRYEIGLSSKKICDLLGLDPQFNLKSSTIRNKPIEVIEILSDSSSDDEALRKKSKRKRNLKN